MKTTMTALTLGAMAFSLAACGGKGDDKLGSQVEAAADNRADALEAAADNLEDRAEAVRANGERQNEAIDDADVNAAAMSDEQKAALINGSAKLR
jgi:predicted small lipoprotein YifL